MNRGDILEACLGQAGVLFGLCEENILRRSYCDFRLISQSGSAWICLNKLSFFKKNLHRQGHHFRLFIKCMMACTWKYHQLAVRNGFVEVCNMFPGK